MYCFIAILLFVSGAIWMLASSGAQPLNSVQIFEFGQAFQMLSALATGVAAVAAWRAAKHSKDQGSTILEQQRWQKRQAHYSEFSSLILDLENHYDVRFYQPLRLYVAMFPNSRKDGGEFDLNCDPNFIEDARLRWEALLYRVIIGVSETDCGWWMAETNRLASSLRMDIMGSTDGPSYEFKGTPTGFTSANYAKVGFKITNCLDAIAMFCGLSSLTHAQIPDEFHRKLFSEINKERESTLGKSL